MCIRDSFGIDKVIKFRTKNEDKEISVSIPAGVDNGDRIRLSGKGEPGINQGPSGDLFIRVVLEKHSIFERDGNNLYCNVPISFAEAALGAEIEIPTLASNKVSIEIPAGTQTGNLFRLKGKYGKVNWERLYSLIKASVIHHQPYLY